MIELVVLSEETTIDPSSTIAGTQATPPGTCLSTSSHRHAPSASVTHCRLPVEAEIAEPHDHGYAEQQREQPPEDVLIRDAPTMNLERP